MSAPIPAESYHEAVAHGGGGGCEVLDSDYDKARAVEGLRAADLGLGVIMTRTSAVLIGFVTGFVYTQLSTSVNKTKSWQLAATSLSVTLVVLAAQRVFLATLGKASYAASQAWASVWMKFMHFATIVMVFLTTNFLLQIFTEVTSRDDNTLPQALASMYLALLAFFYASYAYSITPVGE